MGFFSFIETSFFVSLGITFVLILLMVYHFKERMSCMEQKGDTMFEIINNVVREMTNLKNAYVMQQQLQEQMMQSNVMYNTSPQFVEEETRNVPIREHVIEYASSDDSGSESESESETRSESGTDSESESENEAELKNDEVRNDPIYITFDTPIINEDAPVQEPSPVADDVKIINIHLDNYHTKSSESPHENEITPTPNEVESDGIQPTEEPKEEDHSIHVNKITNDVEDNRLEAEQKEEDDKKESYKDLTIAQLKALVITKGITTSVSKLKKNELISLLENN